MTSARKPEQTDTKTRILDAAEKLFAQNGFKHTSIKHMALMADVNLAAVNYHFGSKDALIEKVIERRSSLLNHLRMQELEKVKEAAAGQDRKPDTHEVLRAFIAPAFTLTEMMQGEKYFLVIAGRAFSEPDDAIRDIFIRHFKPPFLLFFELMKQALPHLPDTVLRWRLQFIIGALAHTMRMCGTCLPAQDFFPPADNADSVMNQLIPFLTSGMHAACPTAVGLQSAC